MSDDYSKHLRADQESHDITIATLTAEIVIGKIKTDDPKDIYDRYWELRDALDDLMGVKY